MTNVAVLTLPRAGLGLPDGVPAVQEGLDPALLDGAGLLEAVGVDPPEEALLQVEVVERLVDRVLVGARHLHREALGGHGCGGFSRSCASREAWVGGLQS